MLSIITPAYNNPEQLEKLLGSIRPEAAGDSALEVIVVDDCSKDGSIKMAAAKYEFASYIRMGKNNGPAAARNEGAKFAKNDILLFLDSDTIVNSGTLPKIKEAFKKDSSIAAICGEYDIEPINESFAAKFKALMARSWIPRDNHITVFVARVGAIKKEVFEKLGGFDTGIRTASSEEWEFGRRLGNNGFTIHYDPSITVRHHFPAFKKQVRLFFHRAFMWVYVFKKYGGFDNTCTTPILALAQICGFLSLSFFILSAVNPNLLYAALSSFILFMTGSLRFFKLTLEREGLIFTLKAIPPALILSCSIVLGAFTGAAYFLLRR